MTKWVILGATSKIAESFALTVAREGYELVLVGRNSAELQIIASDIEIRTHVKCEMITADLGSQDLHSIIKIIKNNACSLFIAHGQMLLNDELNGNNIREVININCSSTIELINEYLNSSQEHYRIIYLSSVAGDRGRAKNSFYGATKKMVDTYLEGLVNQPNSVITIARLGFIDTKLIYGQPGVFYAAKPEDCGKYLYKANKKGKNLLYYPKFWFFIMLIIKSLPLGIFKRLKF